MNVFERNQALDAMLKAHALGEISNENLTLGTAMICELYDAQPEAAKTNYRANPRIVCAGDIEALQAEALEILRIETHRQLDDVQRARLVELSDALWALGSRLPDNVGQPRGVVDVKQIDVRPGHCRGLLVWLLSEMRTWQAKGHSVSLFGRVRQFDGVQTVRLTVFTQ